MGQNPPRSDFLSHYEEIVAECNIVYDPFGNLGNRMSSRTAAGLVGTIERRFGAAISALLRA